MTLDCIVGGIPKPSVQWHRLDGDLPIDRATIHHGGSLTFTRIEMSDAGRYMCSASNEYGSVSHEFDIKVTRKEDWLLLRLLTYSIVIHFGTCKVCCLKIFCLLNLL